MIENRKIKYYNEKHIDSLPQLLRLPEEERFAMKVVSNVLPFRVNNYIVEELIDWDNVPDDPIFRLTFMHRDMLDQESFDRLADAMRKDAPKEQVTAIANEIRYSLNPHPAGQMTANVPTLDEEPVQGLQHKYKETALLFPTGGQTCHAYCTFCFRWPQFVGMSDLKFATDESLRFQEYIKKHHEITDVLFTGGDPMVMSIKKLEQYILPLLTPEFDHVKNIRIGTKSIGYWPHRYVTDKDADDVIRLFEKVVDSGKHLAIMAHYNHWKELDTDVAREAIKRIRLTGANIRSQSPLVAHVNDNPAVWAKMWRAQVGLGIVPYYMFIARETGAHRYFNIPLIKAYRVFRQAYKSVSGLARTVKGPSMSAMPGKVNVDGIAEINGEKVFQLSFLQGRNPDWVRRPFFAQYDENANWLTQLEPALGEEKFFFEDELNTMLSEQKPNIEVA